MATAKKITQSNCNAKYFFANKGVIYNIIEQKNRIYK